MANLLLFCGGDAGAPLAAVGGHNGDLEVMGVHHRDARWRPVPELLFSYWLPESKLAPTARKELLQQCINTAGQVFSWGSGRDAAGFASGTEEPVGEDLVLGANRKLSGLQVHHASVLPALGAALRGLHEASFAGNVLLAEVKHAERANALSYVNGALAVLLLVGLLAWAAVYPIKDELRLRQLRAQTEKIAPSVAALQREEQSLTRALAEQRFFTSLDQRRGEALRVLDELSKVVPSSAYLSNLRYRAGSVEVQGSAENASGLIPLLERSPVFENVGFNAPSNRGRDNRETFSLRAELEQAKTDKAENP
jgi:Tfp pilus assembly protein PilN